MLDASHTPDSHNTKMSTLLTFLGDVFLPEPYSTSIPGLGRYIVNLEAPITDATDGYPGKINLRASRNYLSETFGEPPVAVNLANNHILDYRKAGFIDTVRALEGNGIRYFGAGYLSDDCHNPATIEIDGLAISLFGYVCPSTSPVFAREKEPGVLPIDADCIIGDIARTKGTQKRRIVVSLHWGAEDTHLPKPADIRIARKIIDGGADLVIGHHAHCIQPWETYKGGHIFYGLGNCLFPSIDVQSYYTGNGDPGRVARLKQFPWNRDSLAVDYDPSANAVQVKKLRFDGKTLRFIRKEKNSCKYGHLADAGYDQRFSRGYALCKVRFAVARFLSEPKIPSFRHLRSIYKVLSSKVYK